MPRYKQTVKRKYYEKGQQKNDALHHVAILRWHNITEVPKTTTETETGHKWILSKSIFISFWMSLGLEKQECATAKRGSTAVYTSQGLIMGESFHTAAKWQETYRQQDAEIWGVSGQVIQTMCPSSSHRQRTLHCVLYLWGPFFGVSIKSTCTDEVPLSHIIPSVVMQQFPTCSAVTNLFVCVLSSWLSSLLSGRSAESSNNSEHATVKIRQNSYSDAIKKSIRVKKQYQQMFAAVFPVLVWYGACRCPWCWKHIHLFFSPQTGL